MTNDTFKIESTELFKNIASNIADSYFDFEGSKEEREENFDAELLYVAWLEGEGESEWVVASGYEVLYDCLDNEEQAEEIRSKLENAIFEIINKKEESAALDNNAKKEIYSIQSYSVKLDTNTPVVIDVNVYENNMEKLTESEIIEQAILFIEDIGLKWDFNNYDDFTIEVLELIKKSY